MTARTTGLFHDEPIAKKKLTCYFLAGTFMRYILGRVRVVDVLRPFPLSDGPANN
jgi:hypothetical protein